MDEKVEQAAHVAFPCQVCVGAAMTMPDAHWGYGFPIGGVAAFDAEQDGVISVGGVGFDISCGIRCLRSNLSLQDTASGLKELADALFHAIPAGVGEEGEIKLNPVQLDQILQEGAHWAVKQGFGNAADLKYIEERGCVSGALPHNVSVLAKKRQRGEMGTLGSGNHYLEVQWWIAFTTKLRHWLRSARKPDFVSIHCGSRGLGHRSHRVYGSSSESRQPPRYPLPDRELACAPIKSPEGQQYIGAMNAAINCALANRQILTHLTRVACEKIYRHAKFETLFDVSQIPARWKRTKWTENQIAPCHRKGGNARTRSWPRRASGTLSRGRSASRYRW